MGHPEKGWLYTNSYNEVALLSSRGEGKAGGALGNLPPTPKGLPRLISARPVSTIALLGAAWPTGCFLVPIVNIPLVLLPGLRRTFSAHAAPPDTTPHNRPFHSSAAPTLPGFQPPPTPDHVNTLDYNLLSRRAHYAPVVSLPPAEKVPFAPGDSFVLARHS